ncbi:hypothetical protein F4777DRAFT_331722 [Nemania sp. FL0916]|nr:hypothetical protein F4777DRAFT_331722 [Nemania sp. FL0916]
MTRSSQDDPAVATLATHTKDGRLKPRLACDRCHRQKLRCVKAPEQARCERCARLRTECHYGPRERRAARFRPLGPGHGTGQDTPSLAPAVVPAIPLVQPDLATMLKSAESGWPSCEGNAGGPEHYESEPRFTIQIDLARAAAAGSYNEFIQLTEPTNPAGLNYEDEIDFHFTPEDAVTVVQANSSPGFFNTDQLHVYQPCGIRQGIGNTGVSTAGRLTNLNVVLYECAKKLPSIKPSQTDLADMTAIPHATNGPSRDAVLLALDDVFCVTNEFIQVMKELFATSCHESPPFMATATTMTSPPLFSGANKMLSPNVTSTFIQGRQEVMAQPPLQSLAFLESLHEPTITSSETVPPACIDDATVLLFLSCHCRLTEIYESIFQAIRRCIDGSSAASHARAGIILPRLLAGGFGGLNAPALRVDFGDPRLPPATISMYMILITTLSAQVWTQVGEIFRQGGACHHVPLTASCGIAGPTWELAMKRTDRMCHTIEVVQQLL